MAREKKERVRGSTPVGETLFCWVDKPQPPFEGKGEAHYTITQLFSGDALEKVKAMVRDFAAKSKTINPGRQAPVYCLRPHTDKDGNEVEGVFELRTKVRAFSKGGRNNQPLVLDGAGNRIPDGKIPRIGKGSKVMVGFSVYFWTSKALGNGFTLQPEVVRIVELTEVKIERDVAAYDFEETEGSYEFTSTDGEAGENGDDYEDF